MHRVAFGALFLAVTANAAILPVTINTDHVGLTYCTICPGSGPTFSLIGPNTFSVQDPQTGDPITATFQASATFDDARFFIDFSMLVSPASAAMRVFGGPAIADATYTGFITVFGGTGPALAAFIPGGIGGFRCDISASSSCRIDSSLPPFTPIVFGQPTPFTLHAQLVLGTVSGAHRGENFSASNLLIVRDLDGKDILGTTFTFSDPVPEPVGISLSGLGLVSLGIWAQREKLRNCSLSTRIRAL